MKFKLVIESNNEAFEKYPKSEVTRIIEGFLQDFWMLCDEEMSVSLRDANGNHVGQAVYIEDENNKNNLLGGSYDNI